MFFNPTDNRHHKYKTSKINFLGFIFSICLLSIFSYSTEAYSDILKKIDERTISEEDISTVEVVLPPASRLIDAYGVTNNQSPTYESLSHWTLESITFPALKGETPTYEIGEYSGLISPYTIEEALSMSLKHNSSKQIHLKILYPANYVTSPTKKINYVRRAGALFLLMSVLYIVFVYNTKKTSQQQQISGSLKENLEHYVNKKDFLSKSQQMLKIGEIFPSIAHDIKSPLQSIISATSLIRRENAQQSEDSTRVASTLDIIDELTFKIADDIKSFQKISVAGGNETINHKCDDIINDFSTFVTAKSKQLNQTIKLESHNPNDLKNFNICCNEANLLKGLMFLTFEFMEQRHKKSSLSISANISNADLIIDLEEYPGSRELYSSLTNKDTFLFAKNNIERLGGLITIKSRINKNTIRITLPTVEKHLLKQTA
jgi:hypothetical protein